MPLSEKIEVLQRKLAELEERITELEKKGETSPPTVGLSEPKWVRELAKPLATAVEDLGSVVLFSRASKGSWMSIGDSVENVMKFEPDEIATLLKGLSNPERIRILNILARDLDGMYAQELLEETQLSEGSLHYHLRWLSKGQMITQELSRGKYKATHLGVLAVSLMGILVYSTRVPAVVSRA